MTTVRQKSGAVVVGDIAPNTSQIIHNTSADTHALYANDSGVLRVIGQEVVTSDRTYHVDGSTGDDGNDGLTTGTAFATIQRAVNEVCIAIIIQYHANIRISVAPGIYDEFVVLYPYIGFPSDLQTTPIFSFIVTIHSSTLNAADVVIKPTTTPPSTVLSGVVSVQGGAWQIFGITADETEASGPYGCWKSLAQSFLYTVNCTSVVQSGGAGIVSYFNSFSYHESHQFILNGGSPYILDAEYKAILTVSGSTIELADDTTPLIYSYSDAFAGMSLDGITLNGFTLTKGDSYCDLNSAITDFGGGVPLNDIIDIPNSFIGTNSRIMDMFATKVKSGAVIADDLVPGSWSVIDDGTDVRLYANKSGTLVKSAALT
jgi:hypothetical protein